MRSSEALNLYRQQIRDIVAQNCASNPRVFGNDLPALYDEIQNLYIKLIP